MATKPETLAAMKKLITLTDKITKVRAKVQPAFEKNEKALVAAIAAKKRHLIQTYHAVLNALIDQITPTTSDMNGAKVALSDVNQDEQFVAAKVAEIEKLSGRLDDAEQALVDMFQRGKRLQNAAEKGLTAALAFEKFELQDLASLDREVKDFRKEAEATYKQSQAVSNKAHAATEARDAKGLAAAKAEMKKVAIDSATTMFELLVRRAVEMEKKAADPKFAPDLAADVADGAKDIRAMLSGIKVYIEQMQKNRELVDALAVEPIDVKKALKVLELDAKFEGKLQKALDGPESGRVKALDAIAKEAKSSMDGKAMAAALVKQKVLAG